MKVTNWRRKLAASLVAGGLMAPAAVHAQALNTNLVANPGFENVDTGVACCYGSVKILDWNSGTQTGFAYASSQNYDAGGPLAGGGSYYFSSNSEGLGTPAADVTTAGQVSQDIVVSGGASGALIATGEAAVTLSAQMTSYLNDFDAGRVQVDYLTAGNVVLGSAGIKDPDSGHLNVWNLTTGVAGIPVGTAKLRVSVFADAKTFGPDGYIDNVDVQVTSGLDKVMYLEVNTTTGVATIKNQSGAAVKMDYYQVTSAANALNPVAWLGLQEQNVAGFPPGNGTGNGWEQAGGASSTIIAESYLSGKSALGDGQTLNLGNAFNVGGAHDLVFRYSVEPPQDISPVADFDLDGEVDGKDFLSWQAGFGKSAEAAVAEGDTDLDADVDSLDYIRWIDEFGGTPTSPNLLTFGSVKYVTGAATGVPEPGAIILAGLSSAALGIARLRRKVSE